MLYVYSSDQKFDTIGSLVIRDITKIWKNSTILTLSTRDIKSTLGKIYPRAIFMVSYKIKICNFKYKKVFSIKNVSILNGHNFGPERRTEI